MFGIYLYVYMIKLVFVLDLSPHMSENMQILSF
jgi:hypothetical protein